MLLLHTAQKLKFSIKDFSSRCDQNCRKLRIWSHLLKKSLMKNFIFYAVLSVIRMGKAEGNDKNQKIIHEYREDIFFPRHAFEEYTKWERRWKSVLKENQPDSVAKALKVCDMDSYPNIYMSLKILGSVAITSCKCKRSGSVLKRFTYLPTSMYQNRSSALALTWMLTLMLNVV